jgi:hypothetical protein
VYGVGVLAVHSFLLSVLLVHFASATGIINGGVVAVHGTVSHCSWLNRLLYFPRVSCSRMAFAGMLPFLQVYGSLCCLSSRQCLCAACSLLLCRSAVRVQPSGLCLRRLSCTWPVMQSSLHSLLTFMLESLCFRSTLPSLMAFMLQVWWLSTGLCSQSTWPRHACWRHRWRCGGCPQHCVLVLSVLSVHLVSAFGLFVGGSVAVQRTVFSVLSVHLFSPVGVYVEGVVALHRIVSPCSQST